MEQSLNAGYSKDIADCFLQALLTVKFPKKVIVLRCFLRLVWTQVQEDPGR